MPSRERLYRTEAVVLRRGDLGEADRILTVYSPDHGKLRLIAKGIRRPRSRKAGHLEPFTRVELLLAKGRELDVVTQASAIDPYPQLRDDLERLGYAAYTVELLDRFTLEEGESRGPYRLLVETLERLASGANPAPAVRYYELRLLDLLGYRPELFRCLGCGSEIRPVDQYFSAPAGGVLCPECGPKHREARRISLAALKVLRHYQRSGYAVATRATVSQAVQAEVEQVMEAYLVTILERRLNSPVFLRDLRRLDEKIAQGQAEPE